MVVDIVLEVVLENLVLGFVLMVVGQGKQVPMVFVLDMMDLKVLQEVVRDTKVFVDLHLALLVANNRVAVGRMVLAVQMAVDQEMKVQKAYLGQDIRLMVFVVRMVLVVQRGLVDQMVLVVRRALVAQMDLVDPGMLDQMVFQVQDILQKAVLEFYQMVLVVVVLGKMVQKVFDLEKLVRKVFLEQDNQLPVLVVLHPELLEMTVLQVLVLVQGMMDPVFARGMTVQMVFLEQDSQLLVLVVLVPGMQDQKVFLHLDIQQADLQVLDQGLPRTMDHQALAVFVPGM